MGQRIKCLDPIVDARTEVLVLGSMPGKMSLDAGEYYANRRNAFWKIIYQLFGREVEQGYHRRVTFLRVSGIGLWDVVGECSREGSADASIRDAEPNDIGALLASHSGIRWVFFNGTKAEEVFESRVPLDPSLRARVQFEVLPSTSPANASMPYAGKLERWRAVRRCMDLSDKRL